MRNKQYIFSFLFLISIILLVMPVIPHHHHADGLICMKHDLTSEKQCPTHNHHQENDACCSNECLARFYSPIPSTQTDQTHPPYLFVALLFADCLILDLFKPQEERIKNDYAFRENLHGANIVRAFGLRAPPYFA